MRYLNVVLNSCLVGTVFFTILSCTSFQSGIAPLYPDHNSTASSLQPEFKWSALPKKGITYDFVLYESDVDQKEHHLGEESIETIYLRKDLKKTTHKIDGELDPNKTYYWAVRSREGSKTGNWSSVKTQVFTGVSYHSRTRNFTFTSPNIQRTSHAPVFAKHQDSLTPQEISKLNPVAKKQEATYALRVPAVKNFGDYHALIIGNNDYKHFDKLKTALHDAKAVASLLEKSYGFEIKILTNANRYETMVALNTYRKQLDPEDNLLIYYAGHGWLDNDTGEGYWIPVDGEKDNTANWISNNSVSNNMKAIPAKHILVIADSCYSGTLMRGIEISIRPHNHLEKISKKKARTVLTSGGLEPVMDGGGKSQHSVFASAFIETLNENPAYVVETSKLFSFIRRKVMTGADQIPEYSDIRKAGHEGGDFLFVRKVGEE